MFNYKVNWTKVIKENIPYFFQTVVRLDWIGVLIKPLKNILIEFAQVREDYIYKVAYTAQVIYLEKVLNDKFDNTLRRIYITDYGTVSPYYLYRLIEIKPPVYWYSKWNSATNYLTGEFSVDGNSVYKALANNSNSLPSANPANWSFHKKVDFLRRQGEANFVRGFIVNVPTALVYSDSKLRALINYYRFEGKLYFINVY